MTHKSVKLHLTHEQAKKLHKGDGILLHPHQIGSGKRFMLHHDLHKKVHNAMKTGKGVRMKLSHEEREMNGGSIASFFKTKVLPVYKRDVAPTVRSAVKDIAQAAVNSAANAALGPVAGPAVASLVPVGQLVDQAEASLNKAVGGSGIKGRPRRRPGTTSHHLLSASTHPAMESHLPLPDHSKPNHTHSGGRLSVHHAVRGSRRTTRGGSFLPA